MALDTPMGDAQKESEVQVTITFVTKLPVSLRVPPSPVVRKQ